MSSQSEKLSHLNNSLSRNSFYSLFQNLTKIFKGNFCWLGDLLSKTFLVHIWIARFGHLSIACQMCWLNVMNHFLISQYLSCSPIYRSFPLSYSQIRLIALRPKLFWLGRINRVLRVLTRYLYRFLRLGILLLISRFSRSICLLDYHLLGLAATFFHNFFLHITSNLYKIVLDWFSH